MRVMMRDSGWRVGMRVTAIVLVAVLVTVVVGVMLVRPSGLFGKATLQKV